MSRLQRSEKLEECGKYVLPDGYGNHCLFLHLCVGKEHKNLGWMPWWREDRIRSQDCCLQ